MEKTICKKWNAISITNNVFIKFTVLIRQLSYQNVVLFFKYSKCPGDSFKLTDLHINNLPFQK